MPFLGHMRPYVFPVSHEAVCFPMYYMRLYVFHVSHEVARFSCVVTGGCMLFPHVMVKRVG